MTLWSKLCWTSSRIWHSFCICQKKKENFQVLLERFKHLSESSVPLSWVVVYTLHWFWRVCRLPPLPGRYSIWMFSLYLCTALSIADLPRFELFTYTVMIILWYPSTKPAWRNYFPPTFIIVTTKLTRRCHFSVPTPETGNDPKLDLPGALNLVSNSLNTQHRSSSTIEMYLLDERIVKIQHSMKTYALSMDFDHSAHFSLMVLEKRVMIYAIKGGSFKRPSKATFVG